MPDESGATDTNNSPSGEGQEFEVKVNGETQKVSMDELKNGYQRQADYTRKTQDIADREGRVESLEVAAEWFAKNPEAEKHMQSIMREEITPWNEVSVQKEENDMSEPNDALSKQLAEVKAQLDAMGSMQKQTQQDAATLAYRKELEQTAEKYEHVDYDKLLTRLARKGNERRSPEDVAEELNGEAISHDEAVIKAYLEKKEQESNEAGLGTAKSPESPPSEKKDKPFNFGKKDEFAESRERIIAKLAAQKAGEQ